MSTTRKISLITGIAFIITFVASIPAAFYFYAPVLDHADYILGAGADTRVAMGRAARGHRRGRQHRHRSRAVPGRQAAERRRRPRLRGGAYLRVRHDRRRPHRHACRRDLRQELAGAADAASSVALGQSLVAVHDWTFLLGPGILPGIGNGLLLGYLMYRSELVPRGMAVVGTHRRHPADRFGDPRHTWRVRGGFHGAGHRDGPGIRLGGVPGHLPHVLGIQGGRPAEARVRDRRVRFHDLSKERAAIGGVMRVGPRATRTFALSAA